MDPSTAGKEGEGARAAAGFGFKVRRRWSEVQWWQMGGRGAAVANGDGGARQGGWRRAERRAGGGRWGGPEPGGAVRGEVGECARASGPHVGANKELPSAIAERLHHASGRRGPHDSF